MGDLRNIPQSFRDLKNWVVWKKEIVSGRETKVPYNARTLGKAMSNNSSTWSTFAEAYTSLLNNPELSGLGFMLSDTGIVCVDIDNHDQNLSQDELKTLLHEVLTAIPSYAEVSQSGNGYHVFAKGTLPEGRRKSKNVEMYDTWRFIAMTGDTLSGYVDVVEAQDGIDFIHAKYLGSKAGQTAPKTAIKTELDASNVTVTEVFKKAKRDALFVDLYAGDWQALNYPSQSEADMAFANKLAYYSNGNIEVMESIFRSSGLNREKFDRKQRGSTYGQLLLENACAWVSNNYDDLADDELINYDINEKPVNKVFTGENAKIEAKDDGTILISYHKDETVKSEIKSTPVIVKRSKYTDTANAEEFVNQYGDIIRFNFDNKIWHIWDGKTWVWDNKNQIKDLAESTANKMLDDAREIFDETGMKNALRVLNSAGKNNMITEAQHRENIGILNSEIDADKYLINTESGIYDLENDTLMPHDKEFYMSKITGCGVAFDTPIRWLKFLNEIFLGDHEIIDYIQKAMGYTLTASISEQKIFILHGGGNNGKSVFMDTFQRIMGDYGTGVPIDVLMAKKTRTNVETTLARIKGARLIHASENEEEDQLNEALVKQITGGEKVIARFLYGNEFEYYPEYKTWISTNHKPRIKGTDFSIWRRLILIPFKMSLTEAQADKSLTQKLTEELDQILGWIIQGYSKFKKEGLILPDSLEQEKEQYKVENDYVSLFIFERLEKKSGYKIGATVVYKEYEKWCRSTNSKVMSQIQFGREFNKHFEKSREGTGVVYLDCAIKIDAVDYTIKEFKGKA